MSFRTKLFLVFMITVLGAVSIVAYGVTRYTRAAFEESDTQHTEAIVGQFKKEYAQRRDETAPASFRGQLAAFVPRERHGAPVRDDDQLPAHRAGA